MSIGSRPRAEQILPSALWICLIAAPAPGAREAGGEAQQEEEAQPPQEQEQSPEPVARFTDQVVVSASRMEQEIVNAPAAVTVIDAARIEAQPATDFAEILRQAPGVNVSRMTNSSWSITSRSSAVAGARQQLVLVDGRPVHQEYGSVAWSMLSTELDDLDRIEVVNGPASAVWGANAMTGVINLITRAPREAAGTTLDLRLGTFSRNVAGNSMDAGSSFAGALTHAAVVNQAFSWRLSVGFTRSDPFARPAGEIPNDSGARYPVVEGSEARMPKLDFRADWKPSDGPAVVKFSGGYGGNQGVFYTALGPFALDSGSRIAWGRVQYQREAFEVGAFVNSSRMDTRSLLVTNAPGRFLEVHGDQDTYDLSLRDTRVLGARHILSWGGNARLIRADLGLAPAAEERNEQGFYLNDEIFLGERWRWVAGVRADRVSVLDEFVLSPRTTLLFKPTPDHALRVSWNRAFRSPSLRSSYADVGFGSRALFDLRPLLRQLPGAARIPEALFPAPVGFFNRSRLVGSTDLEAEKLTAWEAGWSGALGDWLGASASWWVNERRDVIDSTVTGIWTTADPPPGWNPAFRGVQQFVGALAGRLPPGTLPRGIAAIAANPAVLVDLLAATGRELPATYGYVNRTSLRESGFEAGLNGRRGRIGGYVNYAWQAEPEATGFGDERVSLPAAHTWNLGLDVTSDLWQLGLSLNATDRAYWTDVLGENFHGWSEAYTVVNASFRLLLAEGRVQPSVRVMNLLDEEVQNHIFGDVIRRQVLGEVRFRF